MTNNAALDGGRETVVQFDHLQHVYPGGVEALKDINLSFRKGEIVAIIGQNGSGKTTLSKHFNGLLRPTSGTVKVCGRDIGKVRTSDLAKTVGYVFQNPNYQIFCASVRDEIKYGLKNLKLPENEIKTRTKEILAQFGLTSVAKTQPVSLSGGTKKVVALWTFRMRTVWIRCTFGCGTACNGFRIFMTASRWSACCPAARTS